jgi:hypothetical protein
MKSFLIENITYKTYLKKNEIIEKLYSIVKISEKFFISWTEEEMDEELYKRVKYSGKIDKNEFSITELTKTGGQFKPNDLIINGIIQENKSCTIINVKIYITFSSIIMYYTFLLVTVLIALKSNEYFKISEKLIISLIMFAFFSIFMYFICVRGQKKYLLKLFEAEIVKKRK